MYSVIYDHQAFTVQEYGGVSRYFCELASRIHRTPGFQARVIAPVHFNKYLPACAVPQTAAYLRKRIPRSGFIYRAANAVLSPLLTWPSSPALIHRTYYDPHPKRVDMPTVVTVFDMIHELFPQAFPADNSVIRNKRRSVEQADHIVCISESTAQDLVRLFGVAREKITVTHLGLSDVFQSATPADELSPSKRSYLLYVGQRSGYKNFELVLKAYASSSRLVRDFDLVAFGGPPFSAAERELAASLNLKADSMIRWTGADADLARAYRHARALVYPSKYEGFGIPPLEAMSSGCAVACSNTSSLPEVVGDAAAMFDPNDADSIRQVLEDLCLNDSATIQLAAAGRRRVRHFSWDRCASETAAAYRRVLGA